MPLDVISLRARVARATFGAVVQALRHWRERGTGPITADSPVEAFEEGALEVRATLETLTTTTILPFGLHEEEADGAPVPSWWFSSDRPTDGRIVLYVHGGAYVAGSHATHRGLAAAFVKAGRARVLLPEYRLAPEHRFPAAVDDVLASYRWLLDEGTDPDRIAFAGDSAGGGLAIALAVAARDAGLPVPAGIACMSPWVDLTATGASVVTNDHNDIWLDGGLVAPAGRMYAPDEPDHPLASPLFADLRGLPPMLVHVGTHEVLLDDARRLVHRARAAGVDASLGEFDGLWHVFQAIPGLPERRRSLRELGAFVHRVTSRPVRAAA